MYRVEYISSQCNVYIRRSSPMRITTYSFPKYLCTLHGIRAYPKFLKKKKLFRSRQVIDGNRNRVGYQVTLSV